MKQHTANFMYIWYWGLYSITLEINATLSFGYDYFGWYIQKTTIQHTKDLLTMIGSYNIQYTRNYTRFQFYCKTRFHIYALYILYSVQCNYLKINVHIIWKTNRNSKMVVSCVVMWRLKTFVYLTLKFIHRFIYLLKGFLIKEIICNCYPAPLLIIKEIKKLRLKSSIL